MCNDEEDISCLACEMCDSMDAKYCIDPFDQDVNNTENWVYLCDDCYQDRCDAI